MSDHTIVIIWVVKIFLYSSSVYSRHLFLIPSASGRSILFLSFIEPIFAWNVPLVSLIFLKRSLDFSILLFSSISLHWSLRKAFLSLLAILWNSEFKWVYLSFSPLPFASLVFTAICKASSNNHFAFSHFFFLGMVLIPASCTMSWTSVYGSSVTLSDLTPWICFSLPLYNCKEFDLGHTWMVKWFPLLSSIKSEFGNKDFSPMWLVSTWNMRGATEGLNLNFYSVNLLTHVTMFKWYMTPLGKKLSGFRTIWIIWVYSFDG